MKRGRREQIKRGQYKYLLFISGGTVIAIFVTFLITFAVYKNKIKESNESMLTTDKIAELVPNGDGTYDFIEEASSDIGKKIEDVINDIEKENDKDNSNRNEEFIKNNTTNETKQSDNTEKTKSVNNKPQQVKDPEFVLPIKGDKIRGYSKDSLIYSDTLEEWITHLGIDIKAKRTSVVKAAESGKVLSIKNDPRYGLTIVIEHVNGFKTVYSNLLSTEFVQEGENVEKGQSIGTVGNSAPFEILDEPHLHFEILKDDINVDPNIYIK